MTRLIFDTLKEIFQMDHGSGPWLYPPRQPKPRTMTRYIIAAIALICALALAAVFAHAAERTWTEVNHYQINGGTS